MRRRAFLEMAGSAVLWPLSARSQQSMPLIGFLHSASLTMTRPEVDAFWQSLEKAGFANGRNVEVAYRWAEGHDQLLPHLALDLVQQNVAVIVVGGNDNSVAAAKSATENIPIVFISDSDPVHSGFVSSLNHPDGNITGIELVSTELLARRLELLHELAPKMTSIVALVNPDNLNIAVQLQYVADAAKRLGVRTRILKASEEANFVAALDEVSQLRQVAMVVANDEFLNSQKDRLVAMAARYKIPAAFGNREFVETGGLMSYGPSLLDAYRQAGTYVARILKGEKPADLPVNHPVVFELVVNAKTAKAFGLNIPSGMLTAADELIE